MSLTINAKTYTGNGYSATKVTYIGPAKTVTVKDDISLSYTNQKPTSVFSGLFRSQSHMKRTMTLTGALTPTGDAALTIDVAIPVGTASADIDTLLNDMGAYLASASYKTLVKNGTISY